MASWQAAALVIGLLVLLAGPALWWIFNTGSGPDPAATARFRQRQVKPDFQAFERHFGYGPPGPLRDLFSEPALFTEDRDMFTVVLKTGALPTRWFVAWIEPMDKEHLAAQPWPGTEGLYPFADNGAGDRYLIDPRNPDPDVLYYEHETGKTKAVGVKLSMFLAAERVYDDEA